MKPKKEETTVHQEAISTARTNYHGDDENGNHDKPARPSHQRSKLKKSRAANKNEHLGVTHRKSSYSTPSDSHQELRQQYQTNCSTVTSSTTVGATATSAKHDAPLAVIAQSWRRSKSGEKQEEPKAMSWPVVATASADDAGARAATGEQRVVGGGVDFAYQPQQIIQSLQRSSDTPLGGLLTGSRFLDGLTPDIVRILLTSVVMNGTSGTTTPPSSQPRQQPLLSGGVLMGASPVARPAPELPGFQWNNTIHLNPVNSDSPSPLSNLSFSQQSPFADIPMQHSTTEAFLQQSLLSLMFRQGGHQAPQANHDLYSPSTIWHQRRTTPEQNIRSDQLDAFLHSVGSTTKAQSDRWSSCLAANSITRSDGVPMLKESCEGAVGDHHQLSSSNLDDETTTDTVSKEERNPRYTSSPPVHAASEQIRREELQSSNRIVLPCGARGMPPEHNFQNAFLVIDPQTRHGDELMCSYRPCREGGVKFRYCSECRLPVAKRNFHQRHSHGLAAGATASARTLPRSSKSLLHHGGVESTLFKSANKSGGTTTTHQQENSTSSQKATPRGPSMLVHEEQQKDDDKNEGFVDHGDPTKNVGDLKQPRQSQCNKRSKQEPRGGAGAGADGGPQTLANAPAGTEEVLLTMSATSREETTLVVREREWAVLLHRRPPSSDTDAISKWLFEVMSISEFPAAQEARRGSFLLDAKASSNVNHDDATTTAMDRRKAQRPPIKDNHHPNDRESVDDHGRDEQRSIIATTISSSITWKERQSSKIQKMNGKPVPKDNGPTYRAKKRKR